MLTTISLAWNEFKEACRQAKDHIIAIDTETNAQEIRDGRGYLIGLSASVVLEGIYMTVYVPYRHSEGNVDEEVWQDVVQFISGLDRSGWVAVYHNAKFDLVSLQTAGISWHGKFYDTMLMCHLINENFPYEKGLSSCVRAYVDKEESKKDDLAFTTWIKLKGWVGCPVKVMAVYARHDAAITLALYLSIRVLFDENVPEVYWEHKQAFLRTVITMERRGVRIDVPLCKELTALGLSVMDDMAHTIGGNMSSSKFLAEILLDRLGLPEIYHPKTGKRTFDKDAMAEYEQILERVDDPLAQYILTHRGWQKSVSSNYLPYVELLSPDGRLRPNYKLHGTKTGRMSCEKPNLQQIPKVSNKQWNGKMKAAFIPMEGYVLYEFDYSQLELRLGAAYARETGLLQVFAEGRDIFTEMSRTLGFTRTDTKTFVYSTQYGAGNTRISNVFRVSIGVAQEMRDHYKREYPGFANMTKKASNLCKSNGKIKLWSGRYRHFRYPKDEAHKAFNSVIQGGAADIVEHVMVRLHNEVDDEQKCRMLLQVHDSVVFEVRKDVLEEYKKKIIHVMTDVRPDFGVVFAVEGKEWGQAA